MSFQVAEDSRSLAERRLREEYPLDLRITDWHIPGLERELWSPSFFMWEPIIKYPHSPFQLEMAIWFESQLSVLAVATPFGPDQLLVRFVEGNPDHDAVLKGQRLPMVMEIATIYAEKLGKQEIWLKPTTPEVFNYCLTKLGFTEASGGQCKMLVQVTT